MTAKLTDAELDAVIALSEIFKPVEWEIFKNFIRPLAEEVKAARARIKELEAKFSAVEVAATEAEKRRISKLLSRVANRMFETQRMNYPSNVLDVIVAWLGEWRLQSHEPLQSEFLAAIEKAEEPMKGGA